jgi:hypothetical protein
MAGLNMIDIMENKVLGPAILKGILKGEAKIVASQLGRRFGPVPEWVMEKLGSATEPELMEWAKRLLSAPTLNDVFDR